MKNISNQKFGRLLAISPLEEKKWRTTLWKCVCDCGNEKIALLSSLVRNRVTSCGCAYKLSAQKRDEFHGKRGTPEYKTWSSMIQRCTNPKNNRYKNYGEKGIKVCKEWEDFKNFYKDMGPRPNGKTLDRIDVNGNYELQNCRWADKFEQARNKTNTKLNLEKADLIRSLYKKGIPPKEIVKQTKISRSSVSNVIWNNCWV